MNTSEKWTDGLIDRLDLPLIVAPMFLVSTPAMVTEACRHGAIGAIPAPNARTPEILDDWLATMNAAMTAPRPDGRLPAPYALNLVVHRTNKGLPAVLDLCVAHRVPILITALGGPKVAVEAARQYGGRVLADVNSLDLAKKALDAGADGLVLLGAGAGGHTGTIAAPALIAAIRAFYDGVIVIAGGLGRGEDLRAAQIMGADLAYMGTRFIASHESAAVDDYKQMVVDSDFRDIVATAAITGALANKLRPSLLRMGLDPDNLPPRKFDLSNRDEDVKAWKDLWSAGHGVGSVTAIEPVATIIAKLRAEYEAAVRRGAGDAWARRLRSD